MESGLSRGLAQIAEGQYFEAHETLEDVWRAAEPAEKDFFQGLVHVAVAWYQAGRGNRVGCERQLEKAARRLRPFAPEHRGVAVELLLLSAARAQRTVARGSLELQPPLLPLGGRPFGCSVVVWRRSDAEREYLLLHRITPHGPDHEGDWAWTPPSGVRDGDEDPHDCARRELREETGLDLPVKAVTGDRPWALYVAEAPLEAEVRLSDEHDRFRWVSLDDAERLCMPELVADGVREVNSLLELERP